ncbi:MAG: GTP-binding protein [Anaerolineaceae bacterium]|nr:GTP-binding protein [Anaerolineaceae bacterium]
MSSLTLMKVVILGDGNVGKTSLVRRFCSDRFESSRVATIGVDFQTKNVQLESKELKLSLWDMAGQKQFQSVRENFYKGSKAAILVYDLSCWESFINLRLWIKEINAIVPGIRFYIAGNKSDLIDQNIEQDGLQLAERMKVPYFPVSARTGEGVESLFKQIAKDYLDSSDQ